MQCDCDKAGVDGLMAELGIELDRMGFDPEFMTPDSISFVRVQEVSWRGEVDLANPNKWSGADEVRRWVVCRRGDELIAYAHVETVMKNVYGERRFVHEKYLSDDKADGDLDWYWHIRKMIEYRCPRGFAIVKEDR